MGAAVSITVPVETFAERRARQLLGTSERIVGIHGVPGIGVTGVLRAAVAAATAAGARAAYVSIMEAPTPVLLGEALAAELERSLAAPPGTAARQLEERRSGLGALRAGDLASALSDLAWPLRLAVDDVGYDGGRQRSVLRPLRAAVQQREDIQLLLGARTAHLERASGRDSPFYGAGPWRPVAEMAAADLAGGGRGAGEIGELLALARGLPGPVFAALDLADAERISLPAAWRRLVALDGARAAAAALRHAADVHQLGPPLMLALARGQRPYSAVTGPRSGIHKALVELEASGLLVRPRPREWAVADPLVAASLASRRAGE